MTGYYDSNIQFYSLPLPVVTNIILVVSNSAVPKLASFVRGFAFILNS